MKPINGRGGKRAFPTENRSNPTPQWNHYRIEANQGNVSLAVNGKVVTRGTDCSPRKGYICLESEGGIVHYRNLRIKVLPDTPVADQHVAIADRGYRSLYDGLSLQNWDVTGDWKSNDWRLVHSGSQPGSLTSEELKAPRGFIVDFRSNDNLPTFQFHGQSIAPASFDDQAISKKNGWNRLQVDLNKGTLNIQCNGKKPIKPIPVNGIQTPKTTRLMIQATGPTEFANIYVR